MAIGPPKMPCPDDPGCGLGVPNTGGLIGFERNWAGAPKREGPDALGGGGTPKTLEAGKAGGEIGAFRLKESIPNTPAGAPAAGGAEGLPPNMPNCGFIEGLAGVSGVLLNMLPGWDGAAGGFGEKVNGDGAVGAGGLAKEGSGEGEDFLLPKVTGAADDDAEESVESKGGVLGLFALGGWPSSRGGISFFVSFSPGKVPKTGFGDTGGGKRVVGVISASSSSGTTAFANGELRVGRVLGRPRPMPKGAPFGVEGPLNKGFTSFTGVPGGVVLASLSKCGLGDVLGSSAGGESDTSILGISG